MTAVSPADPVLSPAIRAARADAAVIRVRHYCPGGREHGGGIGRLVGYACDAAAASGVRTTILDTRGPSWRPPRSFARLAAALGAIALDAVLDRRRIHHFHVAGRGSTIRKLIMTAVVRAFRLPHVIHLHDYDYAADYAGRPAPLRRAVRRMFRGSDAVVVLGSRDRETATRLLGVAPDRVETAPNAVADPGPRLPAPGRAPTILFLGRLGERKGSLDLLEALADPALAGLPWRAVLAGDGPVDEHRARAAALGLADRVDVTGWLDATDARAALRGADILALPSRAEGLAMAVLEGLAAGLAVVTTRVGAHEEVISDGETGLFVTPGDAPGLARALARLIADAPLRRRLGDAGRALFLVRYAAGPYAERMAALYRRIEARRRAPRAASPERP